MRHRLEPDSLVICAGLAGRLCPVQVARPHGKEFEMVKKFNHQIIPKAAKVLSFGSALDEGGFRPLGRRIKLKVGVDRATLRRPPKIPHTTERQD